MARDQGIAKAGNARARKAMIELSWLRLHHQPDSALSKWFRERVGDQKGVSGASPSSPWRANSRLRCGATWRPASFPRGPS